MYLCFENNLFDNEFPQLFFYLLVSWTETFHQCPEFLTVIFHFQMACFMDDDVFDVFRR